MSACFETVKGYSYIVTYEDETQIRYLMYDRDNQEGTKTQGRLWIQRWFINNGNKMKEKRRQFRKAVAF